MELRHIESSELISTDVAYIVKAPSGGAKWLRLILFVALGIAGVVLSVEEIIDIMLPALPPLPDFPIRQTTWDGTLLWFTVTQNWKPLPFAAPVIAIRSDETLWRQMFLWNWDTVPLPFREEALEMMVKRYEHVIANAQVWETMETMSWDYVPQPIRALAFGHMTEYWSDFYSVGIGQNIPRRLMADTLHAIVMAESWFEHRAVNTGIAGKRDVGVAQASDYARHRLRELYRKGRVDVWLADDDYFNPWSGTRFVAIWMNLLLDDVGGNLDLAIQAYYSGSGGALNGKGLKYLDSVKRYRRFLSNPPDTAPAWKYLWVRDREIQTREVCVNGLECTVTDHAASLP